MRDSAFLSYRIDPAVIDDHAKDFAELSLSDQKRFLDACLEKNHLYVNLSEIDDSEYAISDKEKGLNQKFYKTHFS
jgi:adenine-specific DNA-methyltransferase